MTEPKLDYVTYYATADENLRAFCEAIMDDTTAAPEGGELESDFYYRRYQELKAKAAANDSVAVPVTPSATERP